MHDTIGWVATAVFSASYFFRRPAVLRAIQAAAACLWIVYGLALKAVPVVTANVIVALAALISLSPRSASPAALLQKFKFNRYRKETNHAQYGNQA